MKLSFQLCWTLLWLHNFYIKVLSTQSTLCLWYTDPTYVLATHLNGEYTYNGTYNSKPFYIHQITVESTVCDTYYIIWDSTESWTIRKNSFSGEQIANCEASYAVDLPHNCRNHWRFSTQLDSYGVLFEGLCPVVPCSGMNLSYTWTTMDASCAGEYPIKVSDNIFKKMDGSKYLWFEQQWFRWQCFSRLPSECGTSMFSARSDTDDYSAWVEFDNCSFANVSWYDASYGRGDAILQCLDNETTAVDNICPTDVPSSPPTTAPTFAPTAVTDAPTFSPSNNPTLNPTQFPTLNPTLNPTQFPTILSTEIYKFLYSITLNMTGLQWNITEIQTFPTLLLTIIADTLEVSSVDFILLNSNATQQWLSQLSISDNSLATVVINLDYLYSGTTQPTIDNTTLLSIAISDNIDIEEGRLSISISDVSNPNESNKFKIETWIVIIVCISGGLLFIAFGYCIGRRTSDRRKTRKSTTVMTAMTSLPSIESIPKSDINTIDNRKSTINENEVDFQPGSIPEIEIDFDREAERGTQLQRQLTKESTFSVSMKYPITQSVLTIKEDLSPTTAEGVHRTRKSTADSLYEAAPTTQTGGDMTRQTPYSETLVGLPTAK